MALSRAGGKYMHDGMEFMTCPLWDVLNFLFEGDGSAEDGWSSFREEI